MRAIMILFSILGFMKVSAQQSEVREILNMEIDKNRTPSVSYLIFDKDCTIFKKQLGYADIKNKIKVDERTTFNAFSITKTFTALAILQIVEKGMINLDNSAKDYIPNFPYSSDITVKQLLTHTAGISNPMPLNWIHLMKEHQNFDSNKYFAKIFKKHHKIKSPPNEKFAYSNLGYVLLGQMIENISKTSYENYIKTHIIDQLGLENDELGFKIIKETHAIGYQKKWGFMNLVLGLLLDKSKYMHAEKGKWNSFKDIYINGASYGGLIGTANAFMIYLQELLKPNSKLISNESKALLFTENFTNENKPTKMCLAWYKGELNGNEYLTHAGGGGGFYSELRIYPKLGIGSIIMFNRTGMKDERYLDKLDKYYIERR